MTRCLMLSWEYPPVIEGGLARHVKALSDCLPASDVEVHLMTRADEHDAGEEQVAERLFVHRVRQPRRPHELGPFVTWVERMNADLLAAAVEVGDRYSFDVVHGHDWLVAVAGDHLARRFGAPLVMTIHATEYGRHQGWVTDHPQTHIHALEEWIVGRADRLIVCSQYMRGHLADVFRCDEETVAVIPNGIDSRELRREADLAELRAQFARPGEPLLLLVGRLVYEKGFQFALAALPGLIERLGDLRFVVAGSGPHEASLRAQARDLGIDGRGSFVGWVGDDALQALYRVADICVVPSIYEPFGLVALEAMACGCPCIVADTGGLREVVPRADVGLRFDTHDPAALAQVVERVLTDEPLRARLIAQASEHVRGFDWREIADQTAAVYAEALRGRV